MSVYTDVDTFRTEHVSALADSTNPLHAGVAQDLWVKNLTNTYQNSGARIATALFDGDREHQFACTTSWLCPWDTNRPFPLVLRRDMNGDFRDLTIYAYAYESNSTGADIEMRIYLRSINSLSGLDSSGTDPFPDTQYDKETISTTGWVRYEWHFSDIQNVDYVRYSCGSEDIYVPCVYPIVVAQSPAGARTLYWRSMSIWEGR
jgi:hypothetical protein